MGVIRGVMPALMSGVIPAPPWRTGLIALRASPTGGGSACIRVRAVVIPRAWRHAICSAAVSAAGGGFSTDVVVVVVSPAGVHGDGVEASQHADRDVWPFALERCGPWFDMDTGFVRDGLILFVERRPQSKPLVFQV